MNNNYNNILRVSTKLKGSKESSYFAISSNDRLHRISSYKQVFFDRRTALPVLKSCRILRRPSDIEDDDKDCDFDIEQNIDPIDKMMTITSNLTPTPNDGTLMPGSTNNPTVVSNLPSTLQENNISTTTEEDDDVTVQTSNSNPTK
jgi:hypothetical protein